MASTKVGNKAGVLKRDCRKTLGNRKSLESIFPEVSLKDRVCIDSVESHENLL